MYNFYNLKSRERYEKFDMELKSSTSNFSWLFVYFDKYIHILSIHFFIDVSMILYYIVYTVL